MAESRASARARLAFALPVTGLTLAAPVLAWWALGDVSTHKGKAFHTLGPYHLAPHAELIVGWLALVVAVSALAVLSLPVARTGRGIRSWSAVACMCAAGVLAAACWRSETSAVDGANIGGDFLLLLGPFLVAALFVGASVLSHVGTTRPMAKVALTILATLIAPALFGVVAVLISHDKSVGVINRQQYAQVRMGETRSTLHHALGGPTEDSEWFFAPVRAGLRCEYYTESSSGSDPTSLQFRFCFRGDVVVSKERSNQTYAS
jgi:hypothetical protein